MAVMECTLLLGSLFNQKTRSASWTGFVDGLVPDRKLAFGVFIATVKDLSSSRFFFDQFTRAVGFWTGNSQRLFLDIFAFGVIAASCELSVASMLNHEVVSALGA